MQKLKQLMQNLSELRNWLAEVYKDSHLDIKL